MGKLIVSLSPHAHGNESVEKNMYGVIIALVPAILASFYFFGLGMTVQDANAKDLVKLYRLSNEMNMEFATASLHNSFYFVEAKNIIKDRPMVAKEFESLINELLKSNSPKKWFRAYFNHGLINYIYGQKRLLPCDMAFDTFFIDPYGDVMPCNGTKEKEVMGNLNETNWDTLWRASRSLSRLLVRVASLSVIATKK